MLLIRPQSWERYGLKAWIEAAKKRLHHNVLAIAPANKLARIAVGGSQQGTLLRGYEDYCAFGPACVSVAPARNVTNVRKISDQPSVINTPSSP